MPRRGGVGDCHCVVTKAGPGEGQVDKVMRGKVCVCSGVTAGPTQGGKGEEGGSVFGGRSVKLCVK